MSDNENIVKKLWEIFDKRRFAKVRPLLSQNFECTWPQSQEIIRGADNFIALNENYPGKWAIECKRVVSCGDEAVSEVELTNNGQKVYATSFFEIENGKIFRLTEYWSEPYPAPEWRAKWVERTK
ncbi:MAG: nuclear transport factor 2 family protein [Pseudomonadota bacterium]